MLSPEPLNMYYTVFQWYKVRSVFILKCIIGFQSQSIDFKKFFPRADIPRGESVFIEISMDFSSDLGQCYVVIRLNKIIYGEVEYAHLWY